MRARKSFEDQWPELVRGLDGALRARRVPVSRREDIIQETGLRLFVRWSELDPERPVWPFALTVAMNLLKDEHRMQARRSAAPQLVDEGMERGAEEEALARLELTRVQIALQELTPAQRSVLLADLGELPYDDRGAAALKMLRMRARRTLRSVIDRASALIPPVGIYVRRAFNNLGVSVQRNAGIDQAQLVVLSTLGIAGAATIIGAALGGGTAIAWPPEGAPPPALTSTSVTERDFAGGAAEPRLTAASGSILAGPRALRPKNVSHHRHGSAPQEPAAASIGAGGTGIDDDPSLRSRRFRVWVFAEAAVSGREAMVDYEVEQSNPLCGSPTEAESGSRTCIRAEPPRARGEARVGGHGATAAAPH